MPSWHAPSQELGLKLPALAVVARAFAQPTKRSWCYVGKAPAHGFSRIVFADLNDVASLRPPDLARVELPDRIAPQDVPGVDSRVVNAQRRAMEDARQDPDVLNGASFEHPAKIDLAGAAMRAAIV